MINFEKTENVYALTSNGTGTRTVCCRSECKCIVHMMHFWCWLASQLWRNAGNESVLSRAYVITTTETCLQYSCCIFATVHICSDNNNSKFTLTLENAFSCCCCRSIPVCEIECVYLYGTFGATVLQPLHLLGKYNCELTQLWLACWE